jgi:hypothetical protein
VFGWIQVARSFAVSSFVLFIFVLGLNTFPYVTERFLMYWGGEVLIFAAAPWSLYAMRWAANKQPILCFTISLLSAALLFFAKLIGLIVFATNVVAISLTNVIKQRRLDTSTIAMWVACAIGALCFMMFWVWRGPVPVGGSTMPFGWLPIWFSITSAAFSGMSALEFFHWVLRHFWGRGMADSWMGFESSYVLGPLGLLLMVWVWLQLRYTRYRDAAVLLLTIILLYAVVIAAAMYVSEDDVPFLERYFRYAGILFFLLLLMAIDQWPVRFAKELTCVVVIAFGLYGIKNYVTYAFAQVRAGYYDLETGISQDLMSPAILQYLRSEVTQHNFRRAILMVPSTSASISLPQFRILTGPNFGRSASPAFPKWMGYPFGTKLVGRAEKIFVVLPEKMLPNGKAEAALRLFASYEFDNWKHTKLDGMIIYTQ